MIPRYWHTLHVVPCFECDNLSQFNPKTDMRKIVTLDGFWVSAEPH